MKKYLIFKKILLLVYAIFIGSYDILEAQKLNIDSVAHLSSKKPQMDVNDVYKLITKKSTTLKQDSLKIASLGPFFTILPYPGYAMVTGYLFGFVSNISFYSHSGEEAKVSSVLMSNVYSQYKQIMNIVNSNIWLYHENLNLIGDWRYYQFPTYTFGLGGKTSLNRADAIDYSRIRFYEVILDRIIKNIYAGIGFNYDKYWNISELFNPPNITPDYDDLYGLTKSSVSSGISLNFQYDDRLNSNNPMGGSYLNVQYRNNLKALGSTDNYQSLLIDARHYICLSKENGNVLAFWSYDWLTLTGSPPYLDLPATGEDAYNNTARGYVEGRYRGTNLVYAEAEYRFRILTNGLLGGVAFANTSSVSEFPSNKFEKINLGLGAGLRIKMNKSGNTNLCVDYGFGTEGSKGFVFNLNEVF